MKKIVMEQILSSDDVRTEDGGQAKIITIDGGIDKDSGVFFRFQSWGEDHEVFDYFIGRKVRITLEHIDMKEATK